MLNQCLRFLTFKSEKFIEFSFKEAQKVSQRKTKKGSTLQNVRTGHSVQIVAEYVVIRCLVAGKGFM